MERPKPLAVRVVTIASNVVFVAAFAWLLFAPGDKLQSFGVSARFILVAGVGYAIAGLFTPGGQWISVMIPLIVGIVFGMFSGLIRIVT
jgi:ammonia channel protein AmtB